MPDVIQTCVYTLIFVLAFVIMPLTLGWTGKR